LRTYSEERQSVARDLIEFDREWAAMLSAPLKSPGDPDSDGIDPAEVQKYFLRHGRYTAGTATCYSPSLLTASATHQPLASGFVIGTRFHSAPVVRLADARPMHLGHCIEADGRWRLFAFAGRGEISKESKIAQICDFLSSDPHSPIVRHTPQGADVDAVIDARAIFQQPHRTLSLQAMPQLLWPQKGRLGLRDYEKVFCADPEAGDIFELRGIDRDEGCIVLVRPDQYVAHVLPLDARDELGAFFARFMT
jgi:phenol 2-monooxygenase